MSVSFSGFMGDAKNGVRDVASLEGVMVRKEWKRRCAVVLRSIWLTLWEREEQLGL